MIYKDVYTPKRGLRAEVNTLRELSTVIEQNPWMPRPSFITARSENSQAVIDIDVWHPLPEAEGDTETDRFKDTVRAIRRAFGPGIWKKNNPKQDGYTADYYEISREWHGAKIKITTRREKMCELIVHEEKVVEYIPNPDVPLVPVERTKVVKEWKCL